MVLKAVTGPVSYMQVTSLVLLAYPNHHCIFDTSLYSLIEHAHSLLTDYILSVNAFLLERTFSKQIEEEGRLMYVNQWEESGLKWKLPFILVDGLTVRTWYIYNRFKISKWVYQTYLSCIQLHKSELQELLSLELLPYVEQKRNYLAFRCWALSGWNKGSCSWLCCVGILERQ